MLSATSVRNTAKARFSGLGFIEWARRTPSGVVIRVVPITTRKDGRLIAPTVQGGASAMRTNRKPITEGTAINTPNPDAVATARWMGMP